jgi:hypothetical protein
MDLSHAYDDIIDLPHHVSEQHPPMPLIDRAVQFSPFAALTGYEAAITETARLTEKKRELTEEQTQLIGQTLYELQDRPNPDAVVTVVYFEVDPRKDGGSYQTLSGQVKKVEAHLGILEMMDGTVIPFEDIISLDPSDGQSSAPGQP